MANDESRNPSGADGRKAHPKTYGDVMKNIPSGKGGERAERPAERQPRPDAPAKPSRRIGPMVIRKPALQFDRNGNVAPGAVEAAKAEADATAPAGADAGSGAPAAVQESSAAPSAVVVGRVQLPVAREGGEARGGRDGGKRGGRRNGDRRGDDRRGDDRRRGGDRSSPFGAPRFAAPSQADIDRIVDAMPEQEDGEDFASLFGAMDASSQTVRRFDVGEKVQGVVVQITGERAFLDLGGKGEGMIEINELKDADGVVTAKVGDSIEAYVLKTGGGITLTRAIPKGALRDFIAQALESGIPVEGTVASANKGGFDIDLGSGSRAFCPISQIDDCRVEDPSIYVGQKFSFKVTEVKERDIVLSRRELIRQEKARKVEALRDQVVPGARFEGVVTSMQAFGAFVDIGGVEGLVHVSEITYGRVEHPSEVLKIGQKVQVEVLKIDPPKEGRDGIGRISLSMKAVMDDPWDVTVDGLSEGQRVSGKVVRLQDFGAFVQLLPGVDGLIHISDLGAGHRIAHPKEVVQVGDQVECVIEGIDRERRRIALRRLTGDDAVDFPEDASGERKDASGSAAAPMGSTASEGQILAVTVDAILPFGLSVTYEGGAGVVPAAETGTPRGTDLRKHFPVGTAFNAQVVGFGRRGEVRLSKVAAEKTEERQEVEAYMKKENSAAKKGFGTFGDLLKNLKK